MRLSFACDLAVSNNTRKTLNPCGTSFTAKSQISPRGLFSLARRGLASRGKSSLGWARQGKVCFYARTQNQVAGRGGARRGEARPGRARHGLF